MYLIQPLLYTRTGSLVMESLEQILKLSAINFVATLRILIASNLTPNQYILDAEYFLGILNLQVVLQDTFPMRR